MKTYESFLHQHYGSVGIVFLYDNKVLLVHPSDGLKNQWSYPKGHTEEGENHKETAIRELEEEIGVVLPNDFLDGLEEKELEPVVKRKGIKHYWYFTYNLTQEEYEMYFNRSFDLQIEEVDDARFVNIKNAKKMLSKKFLGILFNI